MNKIVDESNLPSLLDRFHSRVRADQQVGPLFIDAIYDWPQHLDRLRDVRSSVMLASGRSKRNPGALHKKHAAHIDAPMFDHWLTLWR